MHLLYAHRYKYQAGRRYARYTAAQRVQFYCMEDLYYIIIVLLRMRYLLTDCILCTSCAHTECAMHDAMCQMRPRSALFVLFRIFILFFCCTHLLCYEYICSTIEISIPLNVVALHRFPVTRRILFMDNTKALLKPSIMREQHYHCAGR